MLIYGFEATYRFSMNVIRNTFFYLYCTSIFILSINTGAAAKPILKVATINVPPLSYMDPETMRVTGSVTKIVQARAKKCGLDVAFIFSPSWARAYQMAVSGTADGLIPTTYAESRLVDFEYSKPALVDLRPSLIVRKDSPFLRFNGLHILDGRRVGIRAKSLMGKAFDAKLASGSVTVVERMNSKGLAEALIKGEADFVVDSPDVINYNLGEVQVGEKVRVLEPSLGSSLQYLALSKKRSQAIAEGTAASNCLLEE
ncbi:MAG: substrate-binding periplasmic protein [Kordiimonas sp.]